MLYHKRAEAWGQRAALLPEGDRHTPIYLELAGGYRKLAQLIEGRLSHSASAYERAKVNGSSNSDSRSRLLERSAARAVREHRRLAAEHVDLRDEMRRLREKNDKLRAQSDVLEAGALRETSRALSLRIHGNSAFRGLSREMLMELAYDLTAMGLHDLADLCLASAEGSTSLAGTAHCAP
jgi:hypothetical protein